MRRHNSVVSSFNVYWCLWLGVLECRCEADSYENENLIRKWTKSVFFFFFFNLMETRMVQIRIAKFV